MSLSYRSGGGGAPAPLERPAWRTATAAASAEARRSQIGAGDPLPDSLRLSRQSTRKSGDDVHVHSMRHMPSSSSSSNPFLAARERRSQLLAAERDAAKAEAEVDRGEDKRDDMLAQKILVPLVLSTVMSQARRLEIASRLARGRVSPEDADEMLEEAEEEVRAMATVRLPRGFNQEVIRELVGLKQQLQRELLRGERYNRRFRYEIARLWMDSRLLYASGGNLLAVLQYQRLGALRLLPYYLFYNSMPYVSLTAGMCILFLCAAVRLLLLLLMMMMMMMMNQA